MPLESVVLILEISLCGGRVYNAMLTDSRDLAEQSPKDQITSPHSKIRPKHKPQSPVSQFPCHFHAFGRFFIAAIVLDGVNMTMYDLITSNSGIWEHLEPFTELTHIPFTQNRTDFLCVLWRSMFWCGLSLPLSCWMVLI